MDQYGEFSQVISQLNDNLSEVRAVWQDQTAQTYDSINENTEGFSACIWQNYANAVQMYDIEKKNYHEEEFEQVIGQLSSRVSAV